MLGYRLKDNSRIGGEKEPKFEDYMDGTVVLKALDNTINNSQNLKEE